MGKNKNKNEIEKINRLGADESTSSSSSLAPELSKRRTRKERWNRNLVIIVLKKIRNDPTLSPLSIQEVNRSIEKFEKTQQDYAIIESSEEINDPNKKIQSIEKGKLKIHWAIVNVLKSITEENDQETEGQMGNKSKDGEKMNEEGIEESRKRREEEHITVGDHEDKKEKPKAGASGISRHNKPDRPSSLPDRLEKYLKAYMPADCPEEMTFQDWLFTGLDKYEKNEIRRSVAKEIKKVVLPGNSRKEMTINTIDSAIKEVNNSRLFLKEIERHFDEKIDENRSRRTAQMNSREPSAVLRDPKGKTKRDRQKRRV